MADLKLNNKFNRKNFLPTFNNEELGKEEIAMSDSSWDRYFEVNYPTLRVMLTTQDIGRPDLLSLRLYSVPDYWWVILKFNNICDPFNELSDTGQYISAPDVKDIQDYYMNFKNRKKIAGGTGSKFEE